MLRMKTILVAVTLLTLGHLLMAQEVEDHNGISKKVHYAKRTETPPVIDGQLDEVGWQNLPVATDFTERRPVNGQAAPDAFRTEAKVLYDDQAIYFAVKMYDPDPDSIQRELTERDRIANDDFVSIRINGYRDGQQSSTFMVTAAGVQRDIQNSNNGNDNNWNAIWRSATRITDFGWVLEVKIPYRELRFPEKPIQEWGLQIEREVRRIRTRYTWNYVDNTKGSTLQYHGILRGIENIKPPVRLSLFPYMSSYVNSTDGVTEVQFNGGADLKFGINEAFTLDATLIPDFGQAGFDAVVLNLGPLEQQFAEQRQFFIEGTDIFSKGGLFFSRRVGGRPSGVRDLAENEEVVSSPGSVDLINAVKVSGRTNKGLGVGFFNALTAETEAEVRNVETEETRKAVAEPLANYNVLVLDQRFGNNSSVSLVNTNVVRGGDFTDANVTGVYLDYINKENSFSYFANVEQSVVLDPENTKTGNEFRAGFNNIDGEHRFGANVFVRTEDYDIDDLGFTGFTNFQDFNINYRFRYLQPRGNLNNLNFNASISQRRRLVPDLHAYTNVSLRAWFNTRKFFTYGGNYNTNVGTVNNLFESRVRGQHFISPSSHWANAFISTDSRRKHQLDINVGWSEFRDADEWINYNFRVTNRYRFSDKLTLRVQSNYSRNNNQQGYVTQESDEIIFGRRDRTTISNTINGRFSFNESMTLNLNFRHYYSTVAYSDYFTLETAGNLQDHDFTGNGNNTFNTWNIDLRYAWWFAPGCQVTMLYRNAISGSFEDSNLGFNENFSRLFDQPVTHNVSLRLVYFLDYPQVRGLFRGA